MLRVILDDIDKKLLRAIQAGPGQGAYAIAATLSGTRSDDTGRRRLDMLASHGYVRLDRSSVRGRVACYLTEAGERMLEAGLWGVA